MPLSTGFASPASPSRTAASPSDKARLDLKHLHTPSQVRPARIVECRLDIHEQGACHLLLPPCLLGVVHPECHASHAGTLFAAVETSSFSPLQVVSNQVGSGPLDRLMTSKSEIYPVCSNLGVVWLPRLGNGTAFCLLPWLVLGRMRARTSCVIHCLSHCQETLIVSAGVLSPGAGALAALRPAVRRLTAHRRAQRHALLLEAHSSLLGPLGNVLLGSPAPAPAGTDSSNPSELQLPHPPAR